MNLRPGVLIGVKRGRLVEEVLDPGAQSDRGKLLPTKTISIWHKEIYDTVREN